jgi:hypothetical protein
MNNKVIEKKVFLDNLPIIQSGIGKGHIDWLNSIGKKVKFIYGNTKGEILITGYIKGNCSKIIAKYQDKSEVEAYVSRFIKGAVGQIILGENITREFKFEIGERLIDDKRDITIINRKKIKGKGKYYKYKCNRCGFDCGKHYSIKEQIYKNEFWILEHDLKFSRSGCSCCSSAPKIVVENINSIYNTDKWMIPYMSEECAKTHTHSSKDKIYPLCTNCGMVKETPIEIWVIYQNRSIGCGCMKYNRSRYKKNFKREKDIDMMQSKNTSVNKIIIEEDFAYIIIPSKNGNDKVKINKEHVNKIKNYRWNLNISGNVVTKKRLVIRHLSNFILGKEEYYNIKHLNNDKLDCTIENLEVDGLC